MKISVSHLAHHISLLSTTVRSISTAQSYTYTMAATSTTTAAAATGSQKTTVSQDDGHPSLTYKQSFMQWLESKPLKYYENDVLSFIPFYPDGDATRKTEVLDTVVDSKGNYIHELYIKNTESADTIRHIVIIHGYGASLGFFYRNFDGLSQIKGVQIHALDLLGFGLSSRPKFPKYDVKTPEDIAKTEDFFVDSIEEWRKKRNIPKFVLMGHSLGGYLSSRYTLKNQDRVEKLVLVSPVGVERSEYSLLGNKEHQNVEDRPDHHPREQLADGPEIANEYYESQADAVAPRSSNSSSDIDADISQVRRTRQLPKLLVWLWERNTSPFSIFRGLGPFAPKMISAWSFSRFGTWATYDELIKMHKYAYKTFAAKGSGEYALTRILAPGALARLPLMDTVPGKLQVPSLWIYGDRDWMSKESGKECCDEINKQAGKKDFAKFKIIKRAGHHIYLDNKEDFESTVKRFIGWN